MDVTESTFSTIFGPVSSRRFGRSLGVDIIPRKLCTLDCVYCEVGRTDKRGFVRKEYVSQDRILEELSEAISLHPEIDCVTYSGSGEPTLHSGLGTLLAATRRMSAHPIVVLTNGTLLWREDVRRDLLEAEIVCPSLNAVSEDIFRRINRPHPALSAHLVLEGLISFRREYRGKYFLEILFVQGLNDSDEEVEELRKACVRIGPDEVHINTVVRPPAETWAKPVSSLRLDEIREMLGPSAHVLVSHDSSPATRADHVDPHEIVAMLSRRPMSREEIGACVAAASELVDENIDRLLSKGLIHPIPHCGREFFTATGADDPLRPA